jgi:hypothetical protein
MFDEAPTLAAHRPSPSSEHVIVRRSNEDVVAERCRILTWNNQWRRLQSPAGRELRRRIDAQSPDVISLTEGHEEFLSEEGFTITSDPP